MTLIDGDYDDDNDNSEDDIHFISPQRIWRAEMMAMRMMILMQLPCNN